MTRPDVNAFLLIAVIGEVVFLLPIECILTLGFTTSTFSIVGLVMTSTAISSTFTSGFSMQLLSCELAYAVPDSQRAYYTATTFLYDSFESLNEATSRSKSP